MRYFYTLLLLAFFCINANSQKITPPDTTKPELPQEPEVIIDSTNFEDDFDLSQIEYGENNSVYSTDESPVIDVYYMFGIPRFHKDYFSSKFAQTAGWDVRLGFLTKKPNYADPEQRIFNSDYKGLFLSNFGSRMSSYKPQLDEIRTNIWRFGIQNAEGYGIRIGANSDITFFNGGAISWTSTEFQDSSKDAVDNNRMRTMGDAFRFGRSQEDGININIYKPVGLNIAYEKSLVFPRTMFWYWVASEATEGILQGLISMFTDKMIQKSPIIGSITTWIIKSGISYGMNLLREKHMNWPVHTTQPFVTENFKASLSLSF